MNAIKLRQILTTGFTDEEPLDSKNYELPTIHLGLIQETEYSIIIREIPQCYIIFSLMVLQAVLIFKLWRNSWGCLQTDFLPYPDLSKAGP